MRKTVAFLSLLLVFAFAAGGCATASTQPSENPVAETTAPTVETTAPADTSAATVEPTGTATEPAADTPKPMNIACSIPEGFTLNADESTDATSVYLSAAARIQYGYETGVDGNTPEEVKAAILAKLPTEPNADGFQLGSSTEATFGSYSGYVIIWTTGDGAAAMKHEARFILTDNYTYRIEYDVPAEAADEAASQVEAFFNSVQLSDSAS